MSSESTPPVVSSSTPDEVNNSPQKPPVGEWNVFELMVGKRGMGKSHKMMTRLQELDDEAHGAYKLGHSMGMRFPHRAAPGLQIHYHRSIESLDKKLRALPDDFHVMVSDDADELVQYAQQLGKNVIRREMGLFGRNKDPQGKRVTPVIVVVDEMVALSAAKGSAQGNKNGDWFRKFVISLRHNHVGMLSGIQDSNAISYINAGLSTKVHCFRITHEWALNSIRASGGLSKEQLERIPKLGVGECITIDG